METEGCGLGAPGLFLISFLDSSVLTFPVINDLLLIELSIQRPARMPLYASMAALGSVLGCVLLFFIAEKGGEALFHKHAGKRAQAIHNWVVHNGFAGMLRFCRRLHPSKFLWSRRACLRFRCSALLQPSLWHERYATSAWAIWQSGMERMRSLIWPRTNGR